MIVIQIQKKEAVASFILLLTDSARLTADLYRDSVNVRVNTSCCCSGVKELKRTA